MTNFSHILKSLASSLCALFSFRITARPEVAPYHALPSSLLPLPSPLLPLRSSLFPLTSSLPALTSSLLPLPSSLLAPRSHLLALLLLALLLPQAAEAYYVEERVTLSAGWNAVMLEATPENRMPEVFFEDWPVDRVYCILNEPTVVRAQYDEENNLIETPELTTLVWNRAFAGDDNVNTLDQILGGRCYFIHCPTNGPQAISGQFAASFLGAPRPPDFAWCKTLGDDTNETLNVVGALLAKGQTKVNATKYFGDGGPFSGTVYKFMPRPATGELALLPVTSKDLESRGVYALTASRTCDYWPGAIGFPGTKFPGYGLSPLNWSQPLAIRNLSASSRTFRLTLEASASSEHAFPPLDAAKTPVSAYYPEDEGAWTKNLKPGDRWDVEFEPGASWSQWLRLDCTRLDTNLTYGAVLCVEDVTASKSSLMRVRVPIVVEDVEPGGSPDAPLDATGLWAGTITLDRVSSLTNETPYAAAGAMTANVLVHVPTGGVSQAELLQHVVLANYGTSNELFRTVKAAEATKHQGVRRISTAMMSTTSTDVKNNGDGFGSGNCQFIWTISPQTKDHPYRHAWHPDHDGLSADYSTNAPSGDKYNNYAGGIVKPELWSINNELVFAWSGGLLKKNGSLDTCQTGTVTWTVSGLTGWNRSSEKDKPKPLRKLVSKGTFSLKRILTNGKINE